MRASFLVVICFAELASWTAVNEECGAGSAIVPRGTQYWRGFGGIMELRESEDRLEMLKRIEPVKVTREQLSHMLTLAEANDGPEMLWRTLKDWEEKGLIKIN